LEQQQLTTVDQLHPLRASRVQEKVRQIEGPAAAMTVRGKVPPIVDQEQAAMINESNFGMTSKTMK
jgi:hypothetical protein